MNHWVFCPKHKSKWFEGSNLFSGWRDELEVRWSENAQYLADFIEIKPIRDLRQSVDWQSGNRAEILNHLISEDSRLAANADDDIPF